MQFFFYILQQRTLCTAMRSTFYFAFKKFHIKPLNGNKRFRARFFLVPYFSISNYEKVMRRRSVQWIGNLEELWEFKLFQIGFFFLKCIILCKKKLSEILTFPRIESERNKFLHVFSHSKDKANFNSKEMIRTLVSHYMNLHHTWTQDLLYYMKF